MIINENTGLEINLVVNEVYGITEQDKLKIINFLQGAVYSWCKNKPEKWFTMRDLMGGENFEWKGTPLYVLFTKHINRGKNIDEAIRDAGIDSGWILKKVIAGDSRKFYKREGHTNKYFWVKK